MLKRMQVLNVNAIGLRLFLLYQTFICIECYSYKYMHSNFTKSEILDIATVKLHLVFGFATTILLYYTWPL